MAQQLPELSMATGVVIIIGIIVASIFAVYTYDFFAGPFPNGTEILTTVDNLGVPPIIQFLNGNQPQNVTTPVASYAAETQGNTTCYVWHFYWGPTPIHPVNDVEDVMIYYTVYINPPAIRLVDIASRYHFSWLQRTNNFIIQNNQPVIKFATAFNIPITGSSVPAIIGNIALGGNYTTLTTYNYTVDPNTPYAPSSSLSPRPGPNYSPLVYQCDNQNNCAAPLPCFQSVATPTGLAGSPRYAASGLTWGPIVGIGTFGTFMAAYFLFREVYWRLFDVYEWIRDFL